MRLDRTRLDDLISCLGKASSYDRKYTHDELYILRKFHDDLVDITRGSHWLELLPSADVRTFVRSHSTTAPARLTRDEFQTLLADCTDPVLASRIREIIYGSWTHNIFDIIPGRTE